MKHLNGAFWWDARDMKRKREGERSDWAGKVEGEGIRVEVGGGGRVFPQKQQVQPKWRQKGFSAWASPGKFMKFFSIPFPPRAYLRHIISERVTTKRTPLKHFFFSFSVSHSSFFFLKSTYRKFHNKKTASNNNNQQWRTIASDPRYGARSVFFVHGWWQKLCPFGLPWSQLQRSMARTRINSETKCSRSLLARMLLMDILQ